MPAVSPPTPRPTTKATVTPTAATALSKAERALLAQLRVDARVDCRPRRQDLPSGASTGVECYVDTPLVARVGIYGFVGGDDEQLLPGYFSRLSDYGVEPGTGDCLAGTPGDASWPDYLPDEGDGPWGLSPTRWGCYRDEFGHANIRLTCYGPIYVGVLGKTSDISALSKWAWQVAQGESAQRDPPGICAAPD